MEEEKEQVNQVIKFVLQNSLIWTLNDQLDAHGFLKHRNQNWSAHVEAKAKYSD